MIAIYLHWFFYGDPFLHRRGKQPGRQELRPQKKKKKKKKKTPYDIINSKNQQFNKTLLLSY